MIRKNRYFFFFLGIFSFFAFAGEEKKLFLEKEIFCLHLRAKIKDVRAKGSGSFTGASLGYEQAKQEGLYWGVNFVVSEGKKYLQVTRDGAELPRAKTPDLIEIGVFFGKKMGGGSFQIVPYSGLNFWVLDCGRIGVAESSLNIPLGVKITHTWTPNFSSGILTEVSQSFFGLKRFDETEEEKFKEEVSFSGACIRLPFDFSFLEKKQMGIRIEPYIRWFSLSEKQYSYGGKIRMSFHF